LNIADENWIDEIGGALYITVHVQPRSSNNEVTGLYRGMLKIRLTTPPVEGAANSALIRLLAKRLGLPKSSIEIVSGKKCRQKRLKIEGANKDHLLGLLGGACSAGSGKAMAGNREI